MYSLDVNFLKDRGLNKTSEAEVKSPKAKPSFVKQLPLVFGLIALVAFPGAAFGYLKNLETQKAELEQQIQSIDGEISSLQNQNQQLDQIQQQITGVEQETQALISVFEKIRPWSAILQEVSDRIPPGVQVDTIQQSGSIDNTQLVVSGIARSYNDVNDFVLFLQRSPFFNSKNIKLTGANLADLEVSIENQAEIPEDLIVQFPQGVKYSITTQLSNTPASQMIREFNNKGAVGLVTRLKTLENKGAILK
ncbi:Fimbrial assembly family protein [Stanieria cyanosphaera PCC 7437]|uniref:Fimbrial assembly family protein n=1 Tax=Stanieria cyanosphaera (strain ATCC 29371 / PCC 7437) TaxID=111780 RepID=K9XZS5_STAC7|nr:PilN domain-containing protein [Stanieria cyanosphaera]AFZ37177.1 Fimbrial assembly family protein [Stanieria cyanosphaera PCC 7437]